MKKYNKARGMVTQRNQGTMYVLMRIALTQRIMNCKRRNIVGQIFWKEIIIIINCSVNLPEDFLYLINYTHVIGEPMNKLSNINLFHR